MARIGYARVSTIDQDLDGQLERLKAEGCSIIRSEKVSGASREGRDELATVIAFLRPGDELVVTRLDRLGRDTRDVLNLIHECESRGAFVTVLDPHVSTRGEMGHIVLTVLGMVAQMERRFIRNGSAKASSGRRRRHIPRRQAAYRPCSYNKHGSRGRGCQRHRQGGRLLAYAGISRARGWKAVDRPIPATILLKNDWCEIEASFHVFRSRMATDRSGFLAKSCMAASLVHFAFDVQVHRANRSPTHSEWLIVLLAKVWSLLKEAVLGFINNEALSRGAAMAFFAVTSLAPILLIVVAIAGLVFGREAAQHALASQLTSIMGTQSAVLVQTATANAANQSSGTWAAVIGLVTLLVTASGVFGEMQSALNVIWKAEPRGSTVSRLIWARALSLGLVAALGFLLITSLAVSAAISAFGQLLNRFLPFADTFLFIINELVALALITALFAAIYKVLPDRRLEWRDVGVGALVTAILFTTGKSLIGWYLGSSTVASSYGAAGALILALLWIYYSSLIFLFGAEFTRAYSISHGSHQRDAGELAAGEGGA